MTQRIPGYESSDQATKPNSVAFLSCSKSKKAKNFLPKISRNDELSLETSPISNQVSCSSSFLDREKSSASVYEPAQIYVKSASDFSVI